MKAFEEKLRQLAREEATRILDEEQFFPERIWKEHDVYVCSSEVRDYLKWTPLDTLLNEMEYGSDDREWPDGQYEPEHASLFHLLKAQRRIWRRKAQEVLVTRMAERLVKKMNEAGFFNDLKTPTL